MVKFRWCRRLGVVLASLTIKFHGSYKLILSHSVVESLIGIQLKYFDFYNYLALEKMWRELLLELCLQKLKKINDSRYLTLDRNLGYVIF